MEFFTFMLPLWNLAHRVLLLIVKSLTFTFVEEIANSFSGFFVFNLSYFLIIDFILPLKPLEFFSYFIISIFPWDFLYDPSSFVDICKNVFSLLWKPFILLLWGLLNALKSIIRMDLPMNVFIGNFSQIFKQFSILWRRNIGNKLCGMAKILDLRSF